MLAPRFAQNFLQLFFENHTQIQCFDVKIVKQKCALPARLVSGYIFNTLPYLSIRGGLAVFCCTVMEVVGTRTWNLPRIIHFWILRSTGILRFSTLFRIGDYPVTSHCTSRAHNLSNKSVHSLQDSYQGIYSTPSHTRQYGVASQSFVAP